MYLAIRTGAQLVGQLVETFIITEVRQFNEIFGVKSFQTPLINLCYCFHFFFFVRDQLRINYHSTIMKLPLSIPSIAMFMWFRNFKKEIADIYSSLHGSKQQPFIIYDQCPRLNQLKFKDNLEKRTSFMTYFRVHLSINEAMNYSKFQSILKLHKELNLEL